MEVIMRRKTGVGITLMALLLAMNVSNATAGVTYTPINGGRGTFNKNLIMDMGDTVPNATFEFTVAPGQPISADTHDNTVMDVKAGVGTPTVTVATFAPSDTTTTSTSGNIDVARAASTRVTGLTAATGVEFEAGEKFATKTVTIDFSSCEFPEPGIYRYIITETANATHEAAGIMHDNDVDRVLDVYITHDPDSTASSPALKFETCVMHTDVSNIDINTTMGPTGNTPMPDKTDGFTNEVNTKDLKITKEVTGNDASRDKYFKLTVHCANVQDADSFVVSLANDNDNATNDGNADSTSGSTVDTIDAYRGQTNPSSVTGAQLKAGVDFYLQHGQYVVIRGLPVNSTYYVTEDEENYKSETLEGKTNGTAASPVTIGTVAGDSKVAEAGFLNTREGVVGTGISNPAKAGIAAVVIGLLGVALLILKFSSKRKKAKG